MDLFSPARGIRKLEMAGADVTYHPGLDTGIDPDEAERELTLDIPWSQRHGRWGPEPRLTSWHADDGVTYRYSGATMTPRPMTTTLETLRRAVEEATGASYNSVLLNLYRDGRDSIGFHSDDEPELGPRPTIASLSYGAERVFEMRRRDRSGPAVRILLEHGSMLVMAGDTQRNWTHGMRKTSDARPRINLTFRTTRGSRGQG